MPRLLLIVLLLTSAACGPEGADPAHAGGHTAGHTADPAPPQTPDPASVSGAVPAEATDAHADGLLGDADVLVAVATRADNGTWTFAVTLSHPDTGWEDYANGWDVVLPDGTVVKRQEDDRFTRLLGHPHVDEQPFTRSQSGLVIPEDVHRVRVRAHELKHGFGGQTLDVELAVGLP